MGIRSGDGSWGAGLAAARQAGAGCGPTPGLDYPAPAACAPGSSVNQKAMAEPPLSSAFALLAQVLDDSDQQARANHEHLAMLESAIEPVCGQERPSQTAPAAPNLPPFGESPLARGLHDIAQRIAQNTLMQRHLSDRISGMRLRLEL